MKTQVKGFLVFVREQGVVGLAVGFILGGAVSRVISSLVNDIINPLVGVLLGRSDTLAALSLKIGPIELRWGSFLATLVDFLIIAMVVYFSVRGLKLVQLDRKK